MQLRGLSGTDVTINAPLGVTVLTDEGEVLGDLTTNNQTITVAQGTGLLAALLNRNYFLQFRFRLLKSSGSGSDF
jgi:GTPase involved in cell partitioning and DNA repair